MARRVGEGAFSAQVALERIANLHEPPYDPKLLGRELPEPVKRAVVRHGDITPRNICRTPEGQLMLIDPDPRVGPPELDYVQWALRADDGRDWEKHLYAVSQGNFDRRLMAALISHAARTYVAYLAAT